MGTRVADPGSPSAGAGCPRNFDLSALPTVFSNPDLLRGCRAVARAPREMTRSSSVCLKASEEPQSTRLILPPARSVADRADIAEVGRRSWNAF